MLFLNFTLFLTAVVLNCSATHTVYYNGLSFQVNESTEVACIQCVDGDGLISTDAEWDVPYLGSRTRVSNIYSPNATIVEVVNGVLAVKNPINSLLNDYYEMSIHCGEDVNYTLVNLFRKRKYDNVLQNFRNT